MVDKNCLFGQDFVLRRRERNYGKTALAYQRSLLGRRLAVLVEGADPKRVGQVRGTSCRYAPVAFEGHAPSRRS